MYMRAPTLQCKHSTSSNPISEWAWGQEKGRMGEEIGGRGGRVRKGWEEREERKEGRRKGGGDRRIGGGERIEGEERR